MENLNKNGNFEKTIESWYLNWPVMCRYLFDRIKAENEWNNVTAYCMLMFNHVHSPVIEISSSDINDDVLKMPIRIRIIYND